MYLKEKREREKLLLTIKDIVDNYDLIEDRESVWIECINAIEQIGNSIQNESDKTTDYITFHFDKTLFAGCIEKAFIYDYIDILFHNLKLIHPRLKVTFMPYKASMWDSLNTIYESALADDMCDVHVVPLPYYEISQKENILRCEINEFPPEIETIDYKCYSLENEIPDIIYVHNIYDKFNTITRLPEEYFTENIKKYTDMLVYVPYHISSPYRHSNEDAGYAYMLPMRSIDKVVFGGKFVEEEAIRYGVPKEKILTLGSPKFDMMLKELNHKNNIPSDWIDKITGKKVIMLNTGCMDFVSDFHNTTILIELVLDIIRYLDDVALIWRPHPLSRVSIKKYAPQNLAKFDMYYNGIRKDNYNMGLILDDTPNYFDAIKASDILISGMSSILDVFALTGKPVLYLGDAMPSNCMLQPEAYYYFYDAKEPWCFFIKKFLKGYDPHKELRKNMYEGIYENLDGTCGTKIHEEVKNELISRE